MTPLGKLVDDLENEGAFVSTWRINGNKTRVLVRKKKRVYRPIWEKNKKYIKSLGFKFFRAPSTIRYYDYRTAPTGWYCDYRKGKWITLK